MAHAQIAARIVLEIQQAAHADSGLLAVQLGSWRLDYMALAAVGLATLVLCLEARAIGYLVSGEAWNRGGRERQRERREKPAGEGARRGAGGGRIRLAVALYMGCAGAARGSCRTKQRRCLLPGAPPPLPPPPTTPHPPPPPTPHHPPPPPTHHHHRHAHTQSAAFCAGLTLAKLAVLLTVIVAAFTQADPGHLSPFTPDASGGGPAGAHATVHAAAVTFLSYLGFDALTNAAEEVRVRACPSALCASSKWCGTSIFLTALVGGPLSTLGP